MDGREVVFKLQTIQKWAQLYPFLYEEMKSLWKETLENKISTFCVSGTFKRLEGLVRVVPMPEQKVECTKLQMGHKKGNDK